MEMTYLRHSRSVNDISKRQVRLLMRGIARSTFKRPFQRDSRNNIYGFPTTLLTIVDHNRYILQAWRPRERVIWFDRQRLENFYHSCKQKEKYHVSILFTLKNDYWDDKYGPIDSICLSENPGEE